MGPSCHCQLAHWIRSAGHRHVILRNLKGRSCTSINTEPSGEPSSSLFATLHAMGTPQLQSLAACIAPFTRIHGGEAARRRQTAQPRWLAGLSLPLLPPPLPPPPPHRQPQQHRRGGPPPSAGLKTAKRSSEGRRAQPLYLQVEPDGSDAWRLDRVAALLRDGAVGIIPTVGGGHEGWFGAQM